MKQNEEKEDLGVLAPEQPERKFITNLPCFSSTTQPQITDSIFHTGTNVCGIIVDNWYYAYNRVQLADAFFCRTNNLQLADDCPQYLDNLMHEFAKKT